MDPSTELASGFTVARYIELRPQLAGAEQSIEGWREVINAFRRRIEERFLHRSKNSAGLTTLSRFLTARVLPFWPSYCLLIDTIQSFREGRITTGDVSPAHSFKMFLSAPRFSDFTNRERGEFFQYVPECDTSQR